MHARFAAVAVCALVPALFAQDKMPWASSWEEAQKSAKTANKLIMVDFYADW